MHMRAIPRTLNLPRVEYAILVPVRMPFSASPLLCEVRQGTLTDCDLLSVLQTCPSVGMRDHT